MHTSVTRAQECNPSLPIRLQCYLEVVEGRQRWRTLQHLLSISVLKIIGVKPEHAASPQSI